MKREVFPILLIPRSRVNGVFTAWFSFSVEEHVSPLKLAVKSVDSR